jgi:hypothetical protein
VGLGIGGGQWEEAGAGAGAGAGGGARRETGKPWRGGGAALVWFGICGGSRVLALVQLGPGDGIFNYLSILAIVN